MAVCVAFVRSQISTSAWTGCARPALRRGRLCAEHRDGLDGALMGMLRFEEILPLKLEDMAREPKKKRRKRGKKSLPVWDTRNVAAATTTPERLEPDPARACPAPTFIAGDARSATGTQL
jgi:hypothetical protein